MILFGGQSAEHEVSCTTAAHVAAAVDPDRYEVAAIGIAPDGRWSSVDAAAQLADLRTRELPLRLDPAGPPTEPSAALTAAVGGTTTDEIGDLVVLPLLHGPMGEDGTMQGLLELADLPYVGSGVLGSAVAMDKSMARELLAAHGLPQTPGRTILAHEIPKVDAAELFAELGPVVFVKPANMGSSIGISRVDDPTDLAAALEFAATYDERIVVDASAVDHREIEFAVLGNASDGDELRVSVPGEIVPGAAFYDYEDKYDDGADLLIPAPLPDDAVAEMTELARRAYRVLRCDGMARVDFLWEDPAVGGRGPLINEVNTIPGFTPISMYPKMWAATGLAYPDLIDELAQLALRRHRAKSTHRRTSR